LDHIFQTYSLLSFEQGLKGGGHAGGHHIFALVIAMSRVLPDSSHFLHLPSWEKLLDVAVATEHDGMSMYIKLLTGPYFQVGSLDVYPVMVRASAKVEASID
jgi:hypothetical protein